MKEEFFSEKIRDEAIMQLKTITGRTAADIGAETGFMSEGLLDAGLKVIAVETSSEMITYMKEKFTNIKEFETLLTGSDAIKLGDNTVDYAFANMYLHHAADPQAELKEIIRILKQGGKVAITDLLLHNHSEIMENHHNRWLGFSFPDLYDWLINAGFRNISIEKLDQYFIINSERGEEFKIEAFIACGEK